MFCSLPWVWSAPPVKVPVMFDSLFLDSFSQTCMCLAHPRDRLRHRPASTGRAYSSNSGRYCSYIPRYNRWGNLLMKGWESWRIGLLCAVCSVGWSRGAKVATSASTEWTTSPSSSDVAATNLNCRSPPGNIRGRRKRARRLVRACDTARHRWAVFAGPHNSQPRIPATSQDDKGIPTKSRCFVVGRNDKEG